MRPLLFLVLLTSGFASPAWAQEDEPAQPADASETTDTTEVDQAETPEPVVDDEFYQDVDDKDFRPSEDIPADQSIPFPSDI